MPREAGKLLGDMRRACGHVRDMTQGLTLEAYEANDPLRWAIERQLSILGEALYVLRAEFPEVASTVPDFNRIIAFRHVLIHGYSQLEDDIVWQIATVKVSELIQFLDGLNLE